MPRDLKVQQFCHSAGCAQEWVDRYFPTREFFAPLAAYLLRITPRHEATIKEFRQKRFGLYTIGLQIRRRKCDNNREDLHCEGRPTIQAGPALTIISET